MLGFGKKNQTEISQKDVFRLLTELKDVHPLEARQKINSLRKSATRDSKHLLDILEVANGILYLARRKDEAGILDILRRGGGHLPSNAMDAVGVQLAHENPNICRWLLVDVCFAGSTPEGKAMAVREVERVIEDVRLNPP